MKCQHKGHRAASPALLPHGRGGLPWRGRWQLWRRMWRDGNSHTALSFGRSVADERKTDPPSRGRCLPEGRERRRPCTLHTDLPCAPGHSGRALGTTQTSSARDGHDVECYSARRRDKALIPAGMGANPGNTMPSPKSQTRETTDCVVPFDRNAQKRPISRGRDQPGAGVSPRMGLGLLLFNLRSV